jgi:hypothetical protein
MTAAVYQTDRGAWTVEKYDDGHSRSLEPAASLPSPLSPLC